MFTSQSNACPYNCKARRKEWLEVYLVFIEPSNMEAGRYNLLWRKLS